MGAGEELAPLTSGLACAAFQAGSFRLRVLVTENSELPTAMLVIIFWANGF
jgi:hypothetical protein